MPVCALVRPGEPASLAARDGWRIRRIHCTFFGEEIDHVIDYYGERCGGFWVAVAEERVAGMFGLEPSPGRGMELRRMYVDPAFRDCRIARKMLAFAEDECRRRGRPRMDLRGTLSSRRMLCASDRNSGYTLVHEEIAVEQRTRPWEAGTPPLSFHQSFRLMI